MAAELGIDDLLAEVLPEDKERVAFNAQLLRRLDLRSTQA